MFTSLYVNDVFAEINTHELNNSFSIFHHTKVELLMCQVRVNTLRPIQNGRRFADDIFKRIFLMKIFEFRLKFQ